MAVSRRSVVSRAGGLLAFTIAGQRLLVSPREARARGASLQVLSDAEAAALRALGDTLVEGASEAGLVEYVDQQLAEADPNDCLLGARFFNIEPPYLPFYQAELAALDAFARAQAGAVFADLDADTRHRLAGAVAAGNPEGWAGPPAILLYLLVRSDAVDVVWGTPEGFESLGIPYMAHIMPPTKW